MSRWERVPESGHAPSIEVSRDTAPARATTPPSQGNSLGCHSLDGCIPQGNIKLLMLSNGQCKPHLIPAAHNAQYYQSQLPKIESKLTTQRIPNAP